MLTKLRIIVEPYGQTKKFMPLSLSVIGWKVHDQIKFQVRQVRRVLWDGVQASTEANRS